MRCIMFLLVLAFVLTGFSLALTVSRSVQQSYVVGALTTAQPCSVVFTALCWPDWQATMTYV